jgi:hypothetical protein
MMDLNLHYELRKQHYQSLLREAEKQRLVQELGFKKAISLRSISSRMWGWLLQMKSPEVTNSGETLTRRTRYGG